MTAKPGRNVITISRQLGSFGRKIAEEVAHQLGYRLVWREIINQAAMRAGSPETALAAIDELGLLGICPSPQACHAYRQSVEQVMEEMAAEGDVVLVGRAGQVILSNHANALHVRIMAPVAVRVERISQQQGISTESALAQIEASDRFRSKYLKHYYKVRWDDPNLYDLTINTAHLPIQKAATLICMSLPESWQNERLDLGMSGTDP